MKRFIVWTYYGDFKWVCREADTFEEAEAIWKQFVSGDQRIGLPMITERIQLIACDQSVGGQSYNLQERIARSAFRKVAKTISYFLARYYPPIERYFICD